MDEVIACEHSVLERLLDSVHRILSRPLLDTLLVLEPRTAMVDCNDAATCVVHSVCLELEHLCELRLNHACITAVTVDLVKGRSEINRRIVALCCAKGSTDDRERVRTHRENGACHSCLDSQCLESF